jgi:hypothetical protein
MLWSKDLGTNQIYLSNFGYVGVHVEHMFLGTKSAPPVVA